MTVGQVRTKDLPDTGVIAGTDTVLIDNGTGTRSKTIDELAAAIGGTISVQNNFAATAAPTVNDDSGAGYAAGSGWYWPGNGLWFCADASVGAAYWIPWILTASGSTPSSVGTAAGSAGSSSAYAKGDHVHASPLLARQTVGSEISGGTPLSTTVGVYICDLTGGPFNLELPDPTTVVGYRWLIVDKYGSAGTHALTLLRASGAHKINGATSDLVLSASGFAGELFCESPGEWICRPPTDHYAPGTPTDWSGSPPTTIKDALDRLAAALTPVP